VQEASREQQPSYVICRKRQSWGRTNRPASIGREVGNSGHDVTRVGTPERGLNYAFSSLMRDTDLSV
jgi:hypothetical protein